MADAAPQPFATESDLVRSVSLDDGILRVEVAGEVNLHNAPPLRQDLLKAAGDGTTRPADGPIVLNLGGVPYMDSSGVAVLIELLKAVRPAGGRVYLTHLQKPVAGLLHIARLDAMFLVRPTDEEALADARRLIDRKSDSPAGAGPVDNA